MAALPDNTLEPRLTAGDVRVLRSLPCASFATNLDRDLALTLNGLSHLGYAVLGAEGWARTPKGDAYLTAIDAPRATQEAMV